jgi:DNA helicase INO80
LHAPPVYYPSEIRDREPIREKLASSSFYDPTTDTNRERERRVSETGSWHTATQTSPPKVSNQRQSVLGNAPTPLPGTKSFPLSFVTSHPLPINLCTDHQILPSPSAPCSPPITGTANTKIIFSFQREVRRDFSCLLLHPFRLPFHQAH